MNSIAQSHICGIYRIKNLLDGKCYIGSSVNIHRRWAGHRSELKRNKHHSLYLQRSWNKHGSDNFVFEIIELCDKSKLIEREQHYIDTENPVYNTVPFAMTCAGISQSPQARIKNSLAHIGNTNACEYMRSPEGRNKFSKIHKGKFVSTETRKKISDAQIGRKASEETRAKMRASSHRGESSSNSKLTWRQVDEIRNRYIPRKVSQRQLATEYGVDQQVIWAIVNNKTWRVE